MPFRVGDAVMLNQDRISRACGATITQKKGAVGTVCKLSALGSYWIAWENDTCPFRLVVGDAKLDRANRPGPPCPP
jgi:hypothetical protein